TFQRGGTLVADATGRLTLPFAPELRPRAPAAPGEPADLDGTALLAAVAPRTGGRLLDTPAALFHPRPPTLTTRQPPRAHLPAARPPPASRGDARSRPPCVPHPPRPLQLPPPPPRKRLTPFRIFGIRLRSQNSGRGAVW